MKKYLSLWFIPILILLLGCSTRVSTQHRHNNHEYRHHNHVSVGVHGRTSGAGVLGALIVGGIISTIIHDAQHHHDDEALDSEHQVDAEAAQSSSQADELSNGYSLEQTSSTKQTEEPQQDIDKQEFQQVKHQQTKTVEWFQVGKDGKCYLMGVNNGVTDVISAVPDSKCNQ